MLQPGVVLKNRWKVGKRLGSGACATVYAVEDLRKNETVELVVKVIPLPTGAPKSKSFKTASNICNTLYYEHTLYRGHLADFAQRPYYPEGDAFGESEGVRFLIIQRLHQDLSQYALCSGVTTQSVAEIGLQVLEGIETIHRKGFLMIDVKPENFMLDAKNKVYFIDFGLLQRVNTSLNTSAGPPKPANFEGTPTFCSVAVHEGAAPSRHDDIEAMAFVLLATLLRGVLPWSTSASDAVCKQVKRACDLEALCRAAQSPELAALLQTSRARPREDAPDYSAYRAMLQAMKARKPVAVGSRMSKGVQHVVEVVPAPIAASKRSSRAKSIELQPVVQRVSVSASVYAPAAALKRKAKSIEGPFSSDTLLSSRRSSRRSLDQENTSNAAVESVEGPFTAISLVTTQAEEDPVSAVAGKKQRTRPVLKETAAGPFAVPDDKPPRLVLRVVDEEQVELGPEYDLSVFVPASRTPRVFSVGRDHDTDVAADLLIGGDGCISEQHCSIRLIKSGAEVAVSVRDNNSTNGTKVDGVRVSATSSRWTALKHGSVLRVGDTLMVLAID